MGSRAREGILPLCSALLRPPGSPASGSGALKHRTDMDLLDWGQRRPQK